MKYAEETVKRNVLYDGRILRLCADDVRLPDGKPSVREYVEHNGGAAVFCEEDGKILLVRQYRYAYREVIYEIPAGKIESGEDPAVTAARELSEETGKKAARTELMYTLYPTPGYTNEKILIYRAYGVTDGEAHPDSGEFVSAVFLPAEKVLEMIERGEIRDAKTIVAVQRYFLDRRAEKSGEKGAEQTE